MGTNAVQCLGCGAFTLAPHTAAEVPNEPPRRARRTLADVEPREFVRSCAPLFACVGARVPACASVLVTGPAGVGKSTEVARVVLEWVRTRRKVLMLDAEMGDELARETLERAGATARDLRRIDRVTPENDDAWSMACATVDELDPELVVLDSVDEWAAWAEGGREEVTRKIARVAGWGEARIVLAIAHFARDGHVFGTVKADHRVDTVITVEAEVFWQTKCTWARPGEARR